ncbi:cytochrome c-type biogenesis protein [Kineosphaera limosa]|nr:cytochrome c-type biogenesis protein [Kineosphaera limosa]
MGAELAGVIADGNLALAAAVALLAGLVSFASPCVLPLVPGFLGYVTGLGAAALPGAAVPAHAASVSAAVSRTGAGGSAATSTSPGASADVEGGAARDDRPAAVRRRVLLGAALFVAGFSVVFITGTLLASAVGTALADHRQLLSRVGGVVVIALALVFLGVGAGLGAQRSWQPRWRPAAGLAGAPLLGVVFAIGWAPCMGPTFGAIMLLATNLAGDSGLVARGGLLGVAYCIGLGLPFLLLAAGWSRAITASAWLRHHHRAIQLAGGAMLLVVGLLLVTGVWDQLVRALQSSLVSSFTTPL